MKRGGERSCWELGLEFPTDHDAQAECPARGDIGVVFGVCLGQTKEVLGWFLDVVLSGVFAELNGTSGDSVGSHASLVGHAIHVRRIRRGASLTALCRCFVHDDYLSERGETGSGV